MYQAFSTECSENPCEKKGSFFLDKKERPTEAPLLT